MEDPDSSRHNLVSSADVEDTPVYSRNRELVGAIDHLMIDKVSGKVAYAVMRFGGILGFGEEYYPVPWTSLTYDVDDAGFVTDITREQLRAAPELPSDWAENRDWERRTFDYWGMSYYWM